MQYEISEVQIMPIKPRDGLVAFASVVLDDAIYLGSIGLHLKLDGTGYRLTYPNKKVGTRGIDVYHPINTALSTAIERAIFDKYMTLTR